MNEFFGSAANRIASTTSSISATRFIGTPRVKVDARSKVLGTQKFADDMVLPRMLHAKLLRSTEAHARIVSIDTSKAAALEGVHAILT